MTATQAPTNGHDLDKGVVARFGAKLAKTAETSDNVEPEQDIEVRKLRAEAARKREINRLETENAELFANVVDPDERQAEHGVNRTIRARERKARLALGLAEAERRERAAKQNAQMDALDDKEALDQRKALRRRRRLTNPNAALASAYRRWRTYSAVLALVAAAGIGFTSYAVAHGLGGENPNPLFYAVEPLFSVPLMIIVLLQSFAAQHGRLHMVAPARTSEDGSRQITGIGWIEIGLLFGSTGLAAAGATQIGGTNAPALFAASLIAPLLVLIAVSLQYVLAHVVGTTIAELRLDGPVDEDTPRKAATGALQLLPVIEADMAKGDLPLGEDGLPSTRTIMRRYSKGKLTAQCAVDILSDQRKGGE
ncbi:hypothetical protein FB384_004947 [Prauserella sediminis]|uniref:Antifreeze glycopeptide AFGP polyprotein n=1 Tax=Prauserella sediminis TaxID=577680 RepID=A0A839XY44_9PSEU|nr:hypothetical protein [Prauserella sediminis]MBB3665988.1 hypothetical protein [Prauserella sediminis]